MARPLEGIRVLELGNFIAGPLCGMLLGDMGADVVKIEPPTGDLTRAFPPLINGESACFANLNRNKRSIVLDLKQAEGRQAVLDLIAKSDVIVENYRPGALEKLGLGVADARAVKPEIVYVSASGYGQTGPYRRRGGVNFTVEAFAGSLSICGDPDDMPMRTGIQTADIVAALFAAYSALTGIINVLRNRDGRSFDVSLSESTIAVAVWETAEYLTTGNVPQRLGHRHRVHTPAQLFETGDDRYVAISAATDDHFQKLVQQLDLVEEFSDPCFATKRSRKENETALVEILNAATRKRTAKEIEEKLVAVGIPCSPVNDFKQVFEDPQVQARNLVVEVEHPRMGTTKTVRNPVLMDKDGPAILRPAPLLGEHSAEVLAELGYSQERVDQLLDSGVAGERALAGAGAGH